MRYALIFDMDGVIIDSNPYHKIAWEHFLEIKGVPFNDNIFNNIISGKTGDTSIRILLGGDLSMELVKGYLEEIDGEFQEILRQTDQLEPVAGVPEFLDRIKKAGHKTALATSAPPGNVDLTMDKLHLREYFDLIIDKTHVTNGKPDPEVYLTTVEKLAVKKDDCIVFEDSLAGIASAISAGLRVVGVTTGHDREELLEAGVTRVIDNFINLTVQEIIH